MTAPRLYSLYIGPAATPTSVGLMQATDKASLDAHTAALAPLLAAGAAAQGTLVPTAIKTSAYQAAVLELVRCDPTGGPMTVTLPSAIGHTQSVVVKNKTGAASASTVNTLLGQTIDDASTLVMSAGAKQSVTFVSDGANWIAT